MAKSDWLKVMALSEQALRAQAACLRAKGYEQDARSVEAGLVEFDPEALEMLEPRAVREYRPYEPEPWE